MMNITPYSYQAWFSVETKHGNNLEFVLDDEDLKQGREHGLGLCQFLSDMLDAAFKDDSLSSLVGYSTYGDVSFQVESATPQSLQEALERCDLVVGEWLTKYRINELEN